MRSRIFCGMRCWTASETRPGMGVEMATRMQSNTETMRPAMAAASERDGDRRVEKVAVQTAAAQVGDDLDAMEDGGRQKECERMDRALTESRSTSMLRAMC